MEVIACYVEGFDDGQGRPVRRPVLPRSKGKLVVLLKAGRTRLGGRAARTHTGALAGSALVQESLFSRAGVVLAKDLEELLALIELGSRSPRSRRAVALVSSRPREESGCSWPMLSRRTSWSSPSFGDAAKAELQALLPPFATVANPLDTTGAGIFEGDVKTHYAAARVMALDPDVDVLLASYDAKNGWVESAQSAPAFVDGVMAAHRAGAEVRQAGRRHLAHDRERRLGRARLPGGTPASHA